MEDREFILLVDDSGYTFTFIDDEGKAHSTGKQYKYYVGIIVPKDVYEKVTREYAEVTRIFREKLGLSAYQEFHATEIFKGPPEHKAAFIEYMKGIVNIIKHNNLAVVVSPEVSEIKKTENLFAFLKVVSGEAPSLKRADVTNVDGSSEFFASKKKKHEKKALQSLYEKAKALIGDQGYISTIVCDEDIRKRGSKVQLDKKTTLEFVDSSQCLMVQLADNMAWLYNRATIVVSDKVHTCGAMTAEDAQLVAIFTSLEKNIRFCPFAVGNENQNNNDLEPVVCDLTSKDYEHGFFKMLKNITTSDEKSLDGK